MSKPIKGRRPHNAQALSSRSKQPSKVTALAELLRVTEEAETMNVSRDYFRANSTIRDGWNRYWPSFKAFLAAGMADDDLYYEALVELVTTSEARTSAVRVICPDKFLALLFEHRDVVRLAHRSVSGKQQSLVV